MPSALASGKKVGLRYKNNITMPKNMKKMARTHNEVYKIFARTIRQRRGRVYFKRRHNEYNGLFAHKRRNASYDKLR